MNSSVLMLIAYLLITTNLSAQKIVPLQVETERLRHLTTGYQGGSLLKIDSSTSLVNFGNVYPVIIENSTGKLIKEMDQIQVAEALDKILKKEYIDVFELLPDGYRSKFCAAHPYGFEEFESVPNSDLIVCKIRCAVKYKHILDDGLIDVIAIFDKQLKLINMYEMEPYNETLLNAGVGCFITDKDNFYVAKTFPSEEKKGAKSFTDPFYGIFVHFKREGDMFCNVDELKSIEMSNTLCYFPGRFATMFQHDGYYYLLNGKKLVKAKDLNDRNAKVINTHIADNEYIAILKPYKDRLVGLNIDNDIEGISDNISLFLADYSFKNVKRVKKYDVYKFGVRDIEIIDDQIYVLLYNKTSGKFLFDIMKF